MTRDPPMHDAHAPFRCPGPLSPLQVDGLATHSYWQALGPAVDALIARLPPTSERAERTTVLTWIYQTRGVATLGELTARLTGLANLPKRKKHLRQCLRAMEKLMMVSIVNFPGDDEEAPGPDEDVVGRNSLVSLTWTGMLWLRRAWAAREHLCRGTEVLRIHQQLVSEEDEAGWNDPYWVENVSSVDPDAAARQQRSAAASCPRITSVFDLPQDFGCHRFGRDEAAAEGQAPPA